MAGLTKKDIERNKREYERRRQHVESEHELGMRKNRRKHNAPINHRGRRKSDRHAGAII